MDKRMGRPEKPEGPGPRGPQGQFERPGMGQASQKRMERTVMILFSFYHFGVLNEGIYLDSTWTSREILLVIAFFGLSVMFFISQIFDFHRRLGIYTFLMFCNLSVYSLHSKDLGAMMMQFAVVVVVVGVCGFVDLTNITFFFLIFLTLYHGAILKSFDLRDRNDANQVATILFNILLVIFLVRFWVKKRSESGARLGRVIADLTSAQRSKDDFMANVSHEIRTPINTISGMSDILLNETNPERMRDEIYAIQVAGHSLMGVVSDILDFSELQSGRIEVVEDTYDITSTINDIINSSRPLFDKSNLEFVVDIDQNLPKTMIGDERKIRRIVMNLLSNAFKFTKEGGVRLNVGFRKENYGINLVLTVIDTGIGMDEQSVEKLFSTYNQVDASRTRKEGGVGLGIAITNALVTSMGGVMTTKSRLGHGTTMQVTIPQRVVDESPIIHLENPESYGILIYQSKEKVRSEAMRDAYGEMINHLIAQFGVRAHFCNNLAELKRRMERDVYTHVFIPMNEYREDEAFFEQLGEKMVVTILTDQEEYSEIRNPNLLYITKPLYALPVMSVLNGNRNVRVINREIRNKTFIAPTVEILVVDDNYMNIKVMEGLLKKYQIHVTQALSGYEAVNKIYDLKYDLIFMDHMMPNMDGVETLHAIRAKGDSFCTKVPIVALTANAIAGAREMLIGAGFSEFLEKPVEVSALEHMLLRMLPEEKVKFLQEEEPVAPPVESHVEVQATMKTPNASSAFAVGDLDVETGMAYCGGKDAYLMILEEYAQKGERNWEDIVAYFEAQDWTNYTITIHGIKSSMKTIGAAPLSAMALELEMKGKAGEYQYILEHHAEMLVEYKRVIAEILAYPDFAKYAQKKEAEELLPEIDVTSFEHQIQEFENAMFELDGEKMKAILDELEKYSYCGKNLKSALMNVRHKVEMSDYMSASESLVQEKYRIEK